MQYTCEFTKEEIEVLVEVTAQAYLPYDRSLYEDRILQEIYNQSVKDFNDKLDEIRIKLKDIYKKANDDKERI